MSICYIGVGSNAGDRVENIRKALRYLGEEGVVVKRKSAIYETEPVGGPAGQEDYFNLVLEVEHALTPQNLLVLLKMIEEKVGRKKNGRRWGDREIDLDILCCGDLVLRDSNLEIPHPRMHERFFVLKPLAELIPDWQHPQLKKTVQAMLSVAGQKGRWRREGNMPETKRLYRSPASRKIAGVCGGFAEYFGIDPTWVRIIFLLAAVFGGFGLVIYLICWVAMPVRKHGNPDNRITG